MQNTARGKMGVALITLISILFQIILLLSALPDVEGGQCAPRTRLEPRGFELREPLLSSECETQLEASEPRGLRDLLKPLLSSKWKTQPEAQDEFQGTLKEAGEMGKMWTGKPGGIRSFEDIKKMGKKQRIICIPIIMANIVKIQKKKKDVALASLDLIDHLKRLSLPSSEENIDDAIVELGEVAARAFKEISERSPRESPVSIKARQYLESTEVSPHID